MASNSVLTSLTTEHLAEKTRKLVLDEALDVFEDSQFMKDALGEHIHSFFLKKKRDEWHKFESTITEWEIKHYLANS